MLLQTFSAKSNLLQFAMRFVTSREKMKYLAFDIEAANGYKMYSICSIGVVIADENFNILQRTNVWINPKTSYNLNGTRKNVGIDLHLDKKLLDSSPDFSQVYPQIAQLLTDSQYLVVGHAVDSDVRMLNAACKHYNLPSINFKFLCTQLMYRLYKGEKEVRALSKIAAELNVTYQEHNSEEDAWMSLLTLKYLVQNSGLSVDELVEKYRLRYGSNNNFELVRPVTLEGQVSKKHLTQVAVDKIKHFAQCVKRTGNAHKNVVFCLARSLELSDGETLYNVVKTLVADGAKYSSKLVKCNLYVKNSITTEQDVMREKRVAELLEQKILTVKSVEEILCVGGTTMSDTRTAEQKALEFLKKHKQSSEDVGKTQSGQDNVTHFIEEMHKGLAAHWQVLPMIPTYICNVDRSKINGGKRILIDAGGTNFRSAVGYFDETGNIHLENLRKTKMPASGGEVLGKEEFYDKIAQNIAYLAEEGTDVGFCFSYPVYMGSDMDGEVCGFSKEVRAPEVVGTRVGAETLAALKKFSAKDRKIVILNDTVATLLGGMATSRKNYSTYLGYIYGTGTNVCCIVDTAEITKVEIPQKGKMLVNMECGGYNGFVLGDFDKVAIAKTDSPERQMFEKMTSGKYLSNIINEGLVFAQNEGVFCGKTAIDVVELKDVSEFLQDGGKMENMFQENCDKQFAKEMCRELVKRAAKMGAIVNAATAIATCTDKSLPVAIVAEGTTFHKLVGYRKYFQQYLEEILSQHGLTFEIVGGEELNLVGTLMATMVL